MHEQKGYTTLSVENYTKCYSAVHGWDLLLFYIINLMFSTR